MSDSDFDSGDDATEQTRLMAAQAENMSYSHNGDTPDSQRRQSSQREEAPVLMENTHVQDPANGHVSADSTVSEIVHSF